MTVRYGYSEEHELFRRTARAFFDKELDPHYRRYAREGGVGKEFWRKAGNAGLLGSAIPEEFGGPGGDFVFNVILAEELGRSVGSSLTGSTLMADLATHILMAYGTAPQKKKYAAGILSGETSQAMPLTEPDAGSDVTAIKTTAIRDGSEYVINGDKFFISNGTSADVLYVVAKTDPAQRGRGMSIIIVDADTKGIERRKIPMVGWPAGDTGELHFRDVRVPTANLLGKEGEAMGIMMSTFLEDRIQIGARSVGAAELALSLTIDYVKERKVFGQRVADFQNTQFVLAEAKTDIEVARAFMDQAVMKLRDRKFTFEDGAMLKLFCTEMENRVVDKCQQLFGGAGQMWDTPIAHMYTAARIQRIYAGTSELQKVAIARALMA
jgi:alkylation response protein AidB-like acyl-CoA dehydrogenase